MSISDERVADLLCTAFEGGSNYWYMIEGEFVPEEVAEPWGNAYTPTYISYPLSVGGGLVIGDQEDEDANNITLNLRAIKQGKELLETDPKYSHYYADVLNENDDAETGDVFLQLCLFGEVIYG